MAGKPSLQVPYPHATGDHQRANALRLRRSRRGAHADRGRGSGRGKAEKRAAAALLDEAQMSQRYGRGRA